MIKILIERHGYNVIEAADGSEAVEKSVQYHPDLILMNLVLPIMNEADTMKLTREFGGFKKVSIVALIGDRNTSVAKIVEAGFDGVLMRLLLSENREPLLNHYPISLNKVDRNQKSR